VGALCSRRCLSDFVAYRGSIGFLSQIMPSYLFLYYLSDLKADKILVLTAATALGLVCKSYLG